MKHIRHARAFKRWQIIALITLQLLFAACATSVLFYRAQGWAPEIINFDWLSYRAFNIYVSLALVVYFTFSLLHRYRYTVALLSLFILFHMVEGALIGFWTKAIVQLVALCILILSCYQSHRTPIR